MGLRHSKHLKVKDNVSNEENNKIVLIRNDDKIMQSIDLTETYAYWTSKDLVVEKEEIKCK